MSTSLMSRRPTVSQLGAAPAQRMNGQSKSLRKNTPWLVVLIARSAINSEGLSAILGRDARFQMCATVDDDEKAENIVASFEPDLILFEPMVEKIDGFRLIEQIAARVPSARIVVISERRERVFAERAFRAGASAYLVKSGTADSLLQALALVASNPVGASPNAQRSIVPELFDRAVTAGSDLKSLSERELDVFGLIAAGCGTSRIMQELGISRKTVETHCGNIKLKLGYTDAKELKKGAGGLLGGDRFKSNNAKCRK